MRMKKSIAKTVKRIGTFAIAFALIVQTLGTNVITSDAKTLTCTLAEHTHTEACYTTHTHTEECYTTHTHTTAPESTRGYRVGDVVGCYTLQEVRTEDNGRRHNEHGHTERIWVLTCTEVTTPVLTCELTEEPVLTCTLVEHTHNDACYVNEQLTGNFYLLKANVAKKAEVTGTTYKAYPTADFISLGKGVINQTYDHSLKTFTEDALGGNVESLLSGMPTGTTSYDEAGYRYSTDYASIDWYVIKTQNLSKYNIDGIATWTKTAIPYAINYVANGGTLAEGTATTYNVETAVTLPSVTRAGYDFLGWFTDEACTIAATDIPVGTTGDKTFYAKWSEIVVYGIEYVTNGGTLGSEPVSSYTIYDQVTLPTVTRAGYDFLGWYSDSEFTTLVTEIPVGSTGNKTFYAKWSEPIVYTITYIANGGSIPTGTPTTYTVNDAVTYPTATRSGLYSFQGWYPEGTMVLGTEVTGFAAGNTGNITVYAKWGVPQILAVTFVDEFGDVLDIQYVPSGLGATAPTPPTFDGYIFTGWDKAFNYISANITVTALYDEVQEIIIEEPIVPLTPVVPTTPVEEEVIVIPEEEVALTPAVEEPAVEEPAVEEPTEQVSEATTTIEEEEAPLAVLESDCIIHWIILLLSAAYAVYGVVRAMARNKKIRELQGDSTHVNA
jgi:uncharacterized repeat protein (TIGR02543 family)